MIPYTRHLIEDEDHAVVRRVLDSSRLTQGPEVGAFEEALALWTDSEEAIAVSTGTSALEIALRALGVEPGDEVLVPSLTFLATANAVLLAGGRPVFVDVDCETLAIDPVDLKRKVGPRTVGAIVVHYAGHVAPIEAIRAVLGPDRFLLEDACHALGAEDAGVRVGGGGDAACFSFHPAKHITTGEGGAITTSDPELATRARRLREHGIERRAAEFRGLGLPSELAPEQSGAWMYEMHSLSGNHRLSDLGAALGRSQLNRLAERLAERRRLAERYRSALAGDDRVRLLRERHDTRSAWHLYPIRLELDGLSRGRAEIHGALHDRGVGVQIHYIPVHLQPFYRARYGTKFGDLPVTEDAYLRLLSLPLYPGLTETDQDYVLESLFATLDAASGRG